jgi:hypothetical protein
MHDDDEKAARPPDGASDNTCGKDDAPDCRRSRLDEAKVIPGSNANPPFPISNATARWRWLLLGPMRLYCEQVPVTESFQDHRSEQAKA